MVGKLTAESRRVFWAYGLTSVKRLIIIMLLY